ncbi:hypothetical protein OIO90_002202 [Microbotryomycetes sp. JL221]|nr:hypothetical protein OIO90_002202 [Microbotryomycetes sp. JL221]
MVQLIQSHHQRFLARVVGGFIILFVCKWIFWDTKPTTPEGEIWHPAILERITLGSPLAGQALDARKYPFLQSRINRDEVRDVFDRDIHNGMIDFWQRFQKPFATNYETFHLDEQVVRGAVDELLGFNGWAAAACASLTRPFGGHKTEDDYSDLARPGALYYFALVVHGADHFLIDQLAVIVQLSKRLGSNSIFVSLVDYASTDSTPFLCDLAEAVMILLGISFRIRQIPPMTVDPQAAYYPLEEAYTRNLALEPLVELWERRKLKFHRVIWLKGFTCPNDILETIRVSEVNEAAMVCSMDWKEHNGFFIYNDRWRTRDMDGNLFRGSKSTSPIDEAPPKDSYGGARYTLHLPFQVFCCESGTHIVDPHKSYYHGVTYQSSVESVFNTTSNNDGKTPRWSEGPCMDSSQLHFCRDTWLVAFREGIKQEAKRLSQEERQGKLRKVHPFMEQLIQSMLSSFAPTSDLKTGYPNSGDYLADETGASPGGGPGMDNSASTSQSSKTNSDQEGEEEEDLDEDEGDEEVDFETEGSTEDAAVGDVVDKFDDNPGGIGRPIDLAVKQEDEINNKESDEIGAAGAAGVEGAAAGVAAGGHKAQAVAGGKAKEPLAKAVADQDVAAGNDEDWKQTDNIDENDKDQQQQEETTTTTEDEQDDKKQNLKRSSIQNRSKTKRRTQRLEPRKPRSLPNHDFDYAIARIMVNPRCVTTYAGVSHTKLALDLFGSSEGNEPAKADKYVLDEWRTPPESFVCQEMRTTGGRLAPKQQRRTGFQMSRLLLNGWRPT